MACDYCCARCTNETLFKKFADIGDVKDGIRMSGYISRDRDALTVELIVNRDCVIKENSEIRFCPFCGEKLTERKNY